MKWYIKLFNFLFNRHGKYAVVDIKERIHSAHLGSDWTHRREACYAAYRAIMGVDAKESWKAVKPWLREWEGKK